MLFHLKRDFDLISIVGAVINHLIYVDRMSLFLLLALQVLAHRSASEMEIYTGSV